MNYLTFCSASFCLLCLSISAKRSTCVRANTFIFNLMINWIQMSLPHLISCNDSFCDDCFCDCCYVNHCLCMSYWMMSMTNVFDWIYDDCVHAPYHVPVHGHDFLFYYWTNSITHLVHDFLFCCREKENDCY